MTKKEAYEHRMRAALDELSADIERLKARTKEEGAERRAELEKLVSDMESKTTAAREKLADLKDASGDAWGDIRDGLKDAWKKIDDARQDAQSRFH